MEISFDFTKNQFTSVVLDTLPNMAFIIEIVVKFNTGNII